MCSDQGENRFTRVGYSIEQGNTGRDLLSNDTAGPPRTEGRDRIDSILSLAANKHHQLIVADEDANANTNSRAALHELFPPHKIFQNFLSGDVSMLSLVVPRSERNPSCMVRRRSQWLHSRSTWPLSADEDKASTLSASNVREI